VSFYRENNIEGFMALDELRWLHDRAKEAEVIVEIGSWMGRSTHCLLSTRKPVVAVDHFKGSASQINDIHLWARMNDLYKAFKLNVGHFPNLLVLKMESTRAAQFFKDNSIDMVFIDGDHDYEMVRVDFEAWLPKCKRLLCGHDRDENGVPRLLGEIPQAVNLKHPGSLWSIKL
jgi:hypothetical protein